MGDHPYGDYGNSPNSLVLTYYTHVCECCQTLCYREVTYEHMLQVVVSRMTNYTSFVTALRFFFFVSNVGYSRQLFSRCPKRIQEAYLAA